MARQQLILLIEDNEDNRIVYSSILTHYRYAVLQAVNGEDGVRMAAQHRPDLILTDLSMPIVDGWEALRRIRQNQDTTHTPVIALTAHDTGEQAWRAAGFSGYLKKPCSPRCVVEEVRRLLPEK